MKTIAAIIILIICIMSFLYIIGSVTNQLKIGTIIDEKKSILGSEIILRKDTLMIMDYSFIEDSYTLENNVKMSSDLVEKLIIKK